MPSAAALVILIMFLALPRDAASSDPGYQHHLSEGVLKLNQGHLGGALAQFEAALSENPEGAEVHYYLGVTHARAERLAEAEAHFKKALAIERTFLSAHFDLGVLYYQQREDEKALSSFALVERMDPGRARVYFYQGLMLRRNGEQEAGEAKLRKAAALDPALAAEVRFLKGASQFQAGKLKPAREAFEGVVALTPERELADSARDFIAKIDTLPKPSKRLQLRLSLGLQHDDNVILEPSQRAAAPSGISEKSDLVSLLYFLGKYQWLKKGDWSGGLQYSYFHNLHQDKALDNFDTQDNHLSASVARRLGKYDLGLDYEFQLALLSGEAFLSRQEFGPRLRMRHSENRMTELAYTFGQNNFKNIALLFPNNSERDVHTHRVGITHFVRFSEHASLYGGYVLAKEKAGSTEKEDDWSFEGHRLKAGIALPPWRQIATRFELEGIQRQFGHLNQLSPTKKREDKDLLLVLSFSRPLGPRIELSVQYLYQKNDSNIPAFEYRRSIAGLILSAKY